MTADPVAFEQAYDAFIIEVFQSGLVWGLYSEADEGWATCPSAAYEDTDVLPFWSNQSLAEALCDGEWQVYQAKSIPLEDFLADWLPGIHEDDAMVGPNWDQNLEGLELEPADVAKELELMEEGQDA